jgi:DNA-binding CsgD family transcriptional regulator
MLKNYRSYRYAVSNGIAPYEEGEIGIGCGGYGPRMPRLGRGTTYPSELDYRAYKRVVQAIDGAVADVLDDSERDVIELKYMNRNTITLEKIAERKGLSEKTVRTIHKRALKKLTLALKFIEEPEIENLDGKVSFELILDRIPV